MAKKASALAGIFDDEPETNAPAAQPDAGQGGAEASPQRRAAVPSKRKSSHPGKKPVLIHIPEDMHRTLRQLSVEEDGEPLTVITERMLRRYLVERGHTKFAP